MELELKFAELACCEPVGDLVTTQEESMETAIPEYCPDIAGSWIPWGSCGCGRSIRRASS